MDKLLEILKEMHPEIDFHTHQTLVDDGVLDSFDIVSLVGEMNDQFDVTVPPQELVPENFNSVAAIWSLIRKLMDE